MNSLALILTEQSGVEFYTVSATGESGISISGLAILCGVTKQSISKLVSNLSAGKAPNRLKSLVGKDLYFTGDYKIRGGKVTLVNIETAKAIVQYFYQSGQTTPQGASFIGMPPIEEKVRIPKNQYKRTVLHSEEWYAKKLQKLEGGKREVVTPAGNIDLLTSTHIIEIKAISGWKCAIGQILVYGHYYPSHQKRIHLFGDAHESFLELVCFHCTPMDIDVTWEC